MVVYGWLSLVNLPMPKRKKIYWVNEWRTRWKKMDTNRGFMLNSCLINKPKWKLTLFYNKITSAIFLDPRHGHSINQYTVNNLSLDLIINSCPLSVCRSWLGQGFGMVWVGEGLALLCIFQKPLSCSRTVLIFQWQTM